MHRSKGRQWVSGLAIGALVGVAATSLVWATRPDERASTPTTAHPGDRRGYHLTSPAEEVPGTDRRAVVSTTISLPPTWTQTAGGRAQVLGFHEGDAACLYRIVVVSRVRLGEAPDAAHHAEAVVPGAARYLLDEGQRRSVAWRVVRLQTHQPHVKVRAVRVAPLGYLSEQLGATAWLETIATATSDLGDECHSGTYRETIAHGLGDALATASVRAYLQP